MLNFQLDQKFDLSDIVLFEDQFFIGTLQNCFIVTDQKFNVVTKKFCQSSPLKMFMAQQKLFVFCFDGILRIYSLEDLKEICNLEFKSGFLKRRLYLH